MISNFSVESCQSEVCEVKRDMIAIKHEIDSVQLVKDEIDDIRESLDRLEAESQRRKNKLLEQVKPLIKINKQIHKYFTFRDSHFSSLIAFSLQCSECYNLVTILGSSMLPSRYLFTYLNILSKIDCPQKYI